MLFYQCKITNKLILGAGCGLAQMAYYCAMESKHISVINGCEKGGSLARIKEAVKTDMLDSLTKGFHVFMDQLSGDLLTYDNEKLEWQPIGNCGLHYSRAEASLQGAIEGGPSDGVKKKPVYHVDSTGGLKPVMIMTSASDVKVELKKNFMSHWCLKGVFHEFIAENINTWDPHPINIVHYETVIKNYQTLAEATRGP